MIKRMKTEIREDQQFGTKAGDGRVPLKRKLRNSPGKVRTDGPLTSDKASEAPY